MSGRVRSRSKSKHRKDDPGSKQRVGARQPRDEKPKQKEVPPESRDIKPDPGKEVEGAPVAQGLNLKADLQKLPQAKAGRMTGYHPDVKGRNLPFLEPIKILVAGSNLKTDLQKLPQAKAEHITGCHPDVKGRNLPLLEPIKMPEAGEGQPQS